MSELRKDPIADRWVIIAAERAGRPSDFKHAPTIRDGNVSCPFCPGRENETPPEVTAFREGGEGADPSGWSIRVVGNKFPALNVMNEIHRVGVGLYDMMSGFGTHEVIVETPDHNHRVDEMPIPQVEKLLMMYRHRLDELEKDSRLKYILIFKNYGSVAGASLSHPHSQIIATPVTPRNVKTKLEGAGAYFLQKERCIFCDILRQELSVGERVVFQNDTFVVIAPFASRFPFELLIFPRRHVSDFKKITDEEIHDLALALHDLFSRLVTVLQDPPYNWVLYTAPNLVPRPGRPHYWGTIQDDFHWHIEVIPRLTRVAGFEWGTGFYINTMPPERAAQYLREKRADS